MIRERYYNKGMELEEYKTYVKQGRTIRAGSPEHLFMHSAAERARQYTAQMNAGSPSQERLQELFFTLTGQPKEESFHIFPPFYTDFGQNIVVGKDVFINEGCSFQDQGGIVIGDGCLIGHQVVLATLNHVQDPAHRADMIPAPILLGKNVWIGAHATILAGVTVGDNSIVAAGAVVTKDVPANTVVGGVPARVIKKIQRPEGENK